MSAWLYSTLEFSLVIFLVFFVLSHGSFHISLFLAVGVIALFYWYHLPPPSDNIAHLSANSFIIAHRGAGFDAPENTVAAIKEAKANGATAVEFDVDYTADKVAVVFHDDTVDRCTNGTGRLNEMTLEKVRQLDASARHPKKDLFPNERIPTLEEIVRLCLDNDLTMFIDVKSNIELSTEKLVDLFKRYPAMYKKAVVCSFNPLIVYSVRAKNRNIVAGLTHRSHYLTRKVDKTENEGPWYTKLTYPILDIILQWSHSCWMWYLCGNSFFLANLGDVSQSTVEHFAQRGVQVVVWTANQPHDRNYFMHSLHCPIITDTMLPDGCEVQKN